MAAQIELNPETGLFDVVDPVTDQTIQQSSQDGVIYDDAYSMPVDPQAPEEDLLDVMDPDPLPDTQIFEPDEEDSSSFDLYSVAPSSASYTPQAWQVNLAQSRGFGEHYLMWAQRVYYSSSASYWKYFEVVGRNIRREGDVYTYEDCDLYTFYNYSGDVSYDVAESSGSVNGSSFVVFSDLYFDYAGGFPTDHVTPFVLFAFLILLMVLMLSRRSR